MRAISLNQPWASAIAASVKRHETRSWAPPASTVGQRIAIHATKGWGEGGWTAREQWIRDASTEPDHREWMLRMGLIRPVTVMPITGSEYVEWHPLVLGIPRGVVLCTAVLTSFQRTRGHGIEAQDDLDFELGDYSRGRYAWRLEDLRVLTKPVPLKGAQGLFTVPSDVERQIKEAGG